MTHHEQDDALTRLVKRFEKRADECREKANDLSKEWRQQKADDKNDGLAREARQHWYAGQLCDRLAEHAHCRDFEAELLGSYADQVDISDSFRAAEEKLMRDVGIRFFPRNVDEFLWKVMQAA